MFPFPSPGEAVTMPQNDAFWTLVDSAKFGDLDLMPEDFESTSWAELLGRLLIEGATVEMKNPDTAIVGMYRMKLTVVLFKGREVYIARDKKE